MGSVYIHVYISEEDEELRDWVARLKRDNVVVTATVRDILRAHIRGEKKLTEESIAAAVVRRLKEDGLVLSGGGLDVVEGEADLIEAALSRAAKEFV